MKDNTKKLLVLLIDGINNLDKINTEHKKLILDCLNIIFENNISDNIFESIVKRMIDKDFPCIRFPKGFAELIED